MPKAFYLVFLSLGALGAGLRTQRQLPAIIESKSIRIISRNFFGIWIVVSFPSSVLVIVGPV